MSTVKGLFTTLDAAKVSIPLRGRCNVNELYFKQKECLGLVSIPLRGRCNVNKGEEIVLVELEGGFHPLAGKM